MLSEIDGDSPPLAAIFGLSGKKLTRAEERFFSDSNPFGFILFARNCENPKQLKALTDSLRHCLNRDVPILIDQEGGRVQRLKPPHWKQYPSAQTAGDSLAATTASIATDLRRAGITVNCAPVLDVTFPETHIAIGDRSFSDNPETVAKCGALVCRVYLENGIVPIVKHLPGLGRADLDTHHDLPTVAAKLADLKRGDFAPFRDVLARDFAVAVWGMIGHAIYAAIDPDNPASCSPKLITEIIRKHMKFDGLLLSDDLSMEALGKVGSAADRAQAVLQAGCDIALHCNGKLAEMKRVARSIEKMTDAAILRYNRGVSWMAARNDIGNG